MVLHGFGRIENNKQVSHLQGKVSGGERKEWGEKRGGRRKGEKRGRGEGRNEGEERGGRSEGEERGRGERERREGDIRER